jgi:hypothetical protein
MEEGGGVSFMVVVGIFGIGCESVHSDPTDFGHANC